ncbi:DUF4158 domain-containing protein [Nocardia miyunensis]|uniref:DUF4158 domain-containing protein n=1 Tax=Nocardia miyunensis TaxID=282684 RepID=UPI000837410E|nr:DUF4158 domain-containing protein [Nocardia miyunensis]
MRQEWSTEDLIGSWTLVGDDWRRVGNKTGATRLGFGLLLRFFEIEARFPDRPEELPAVAVAYMAEQVKVDPGFLSEYRWSGRTIEYHRAQVRDAFGFREFSRSDEDKLAAWLAGAGGSAGGEGADRGPAPRAWQGEHLVPPCRSGRGPP